MYGDLSAHSGYNALARNPEYAVKFLDEFQDRLLFGTDICSANADLPLSGFLLNLVQQGKISQEVFNKVAKDNAVHLLNL